MKVDDFHICYMDIKLFVYQEDSFIQKLRWIIDLEIEEWFNLYPLDITFLTSIFYNMMVKT